MNPIDINNSEIVNNHRGQFAEGTAETEPTHSDVTDFLLENNYGAYNIDVSFDDMQGFWRWYADITPYNEI